MGWSLAIALRSPIPRKCIPQGCTCSTRSVAGSVGPPASSTSVRRPRSVSSFAAQPPLMPEPTTMASYRSALAMRPAAFHAYGCVTHKPPRHDLDFQHVLHHALTGEVAVQDEPLEAPVRALRLGAAVGRLLEGVDRGLARGES